MFHKQSILFLSFAFCFFLYGCKQNPLPQTTDQAQVSSDAAQIKEIEKSAQEKSFSPDRRLEVFIQSLEGPTEGAGSNYRLSVIDTEQTKVIFSRAFEYPNQKAELAIVKVLDNLVFIEEKIKAEALSPDKPQPETLRKYYLIQPDTPDFKELACKDFVGAYEIKNISAESYSCYGQKTGSDALVTEEVALPKYELASAGASDVQTKELGTQKAELEPFDSVKGTTPYGSRATLKVFEDEKLIFQKSFSGKCSGCQWVNQDNYQEAFKIESIAPDQLLLTQIVIDREDKEAGPIYNSLLVVPSRKKLIPLDCNEGAKELAYVSQITNGVYRCKYLSKVTGKELAQEAKELPLPKV